jgi:(p)ppGpp synthase/HD superfamily hydrolase
MMILEAIKLAKTAHEGQKRRFTGEAYIMHPARVAMQVSLLTYATEQMIAAAWLHDVIEDTYITYKHIVNITRDVNVANLVKELTFDESQYPDLDYAAKKCKQNEHIAVASFEAKSIKILDRLDNLEDFAQSIRTGDCQREKLERYVKTSWEMQELLVKSNSKVGEVPKVDDELLVYLQVQLIRLNREFNLGAIIL